MSISPTVAEPVLALRGLSKRFEGVQALADVSFELAPSEIHALVGQNGAGKSTLINIVSGLMQADAGEIRMGGTAVALRNTSDAMSRGIATVYQELSVLPNLTIAQNIVLGREPRRHGFLDVPAMHRRAQQALARIELSLPIDTPVASLSLAERQLIEIARALANKPSVLILDEPTAPLGAAEAQRLIAILRGLRRQGIAIIYASHRFSEILEVCDRATVLRNGRVVTTARLETWTAQDLTEAMIGRSTDAFVPSARTPPGPPVLEVRDLGWRKRLSGVNFDLHKGEVIVLTGLLGAGQNEIARLVAGAQWPDRGSVSVREKPVRLRTPRQAIAQGVCLLTDDRKQEGILPNRTLRENIAVASLGHRRQLGIFVDRAAEVRATCQASEDLDVLAPSLEAPMRQLSGGNQQKSLLARWVLADAQIFVLIEPTRGVDVGARAEIYRRLEALVRGGKSLLVVSSDLAEVLLLAHRILIVAHGRIACEARPEGLSEEELNLLVQNA
jgi:ABC-type sugar transport system ATPase subunit